MAKATDNTRPAGGHTAFIPVSVPKSRALYQLLQGTGRVTGPAAEKVLNTLSVKADPGDGSVPVVNLLATPSKAGRSSEAAAAASGLALLLQKARAEGHEAADLVAYLASQLGVHEDEPEPEPEPEPAPAEPVAAAEPEPVPAGPAPVPTLT
jgi:hypothetical protein